MIKHLKRLVWLFLSGIAIFTTITLLTIAPKHTPQQSELIKGVWLTHVGNAFLTYTHTTDNIFHQLSLLNYNRVYVDVYNGGTSYSSKYATRNYITSLPFTNPLRKAIAEGKRQGLKIYAWYEHGMMTFANAELARQHPNWVLTTNQGDKLIDGHWWLDPDNPEVQQYFVDLFTEVAASFIGLAGIQLDDHWGIPIQFGDLSTAMTELTYKVTTAIKQTNPDLIISLSPNPLGFSVKKYAQNWLAWVEADLIDELVMQLYRPTSQEVALAIANSRLPQVKQHAEVAVGIYAGSWENLKPLAEIQQQLTVVKANNYGYVIFPWETFLGFLRWQKQAVKAKYLTAI